MKGAWIREQHATIARHRRECVQRLAYFLQWRCANLGPYFLVKEGKSVQLHMTQLPVTGSDGVWALFWSCRCKVLRTEVLGKGGRLLLTCHFPEFLPPKCLLWLISLATPSLLMWKQPAPAERSPDTSSRGWIWRQNPHSNRLNVQNETLGCDLWTTDSKIPRTETLGTTPLSSQTSYNPGQQLVLVLPYQPSSGQPLRAPPLPSLLAAWGRAEWPALGREAAVQRGGVPKQHLILVNKKGAFNSHLPPWWQHRTGCVPVNVWPQRCSCMGWAERVAHRFLEGCGESPSWCLFSK